VALILTRQNVEVLDRSAFPPASDLAKGAYVLADTEGTPDVILIASGSEVHVALDARQVLSGRGIQARVVSMPSWELFEAQSQDYRDSVLPPDVTARLAVEAGVSMGWGRYVGLEGDVVSVDRFGESAPYKVLMEKFGFTGQEVAERAAKLLGG
jgi:transketolase